MNTPKVPGRLLAWTSLLVALGASVAANVAYARAGVGPRLSAGVAPVLVVLAAAMLERVPLATARWWQRWLSGLGLAAVAGTAFVVSYMHQYALVIEYGNPPLTAALLPVSVDGLIVMASICLAVIAERRRELAAQPDEVPVLSEPAQDGLVESEQPSGQMMSAPRQPRARRHTPTVADRVAKYAAKNPDATPAVIAVKVGCTERTVRRHLATLMAEQPMPAVADTERVNGVEVPELVEVTR